MLTQFYIGAVVLCSILLLIYYIFYANMILKINKNLESSQKEQMECTTDPMEIETVRYQMKYLYKKDSIKKTIMIFSLTLIIFAAIIILTGIYIQYVKNYNDLSILPGLIILLFAISVIATFKKEPFTQNKVVGEYDTKYTNMKDKLQTIVDTRYPDVSSLPDDILTALAQRFKNYNDLHEIVQMPLNSNYEVMNVLKLRLTLPEGGINVEELMKYMKFNTDVARTVKGRDSDGNVVDVPVYLTDIDLIRDRSSRIPFINDLYGNNTYNPYETLKDSLKAHKATLLVWAVIFCYIIFHSLYRTYGVNGHFTTIYTISIIAFIIVILMRLFVSDYY